MMNVYLVGGAIRDRLLGLPVADRDWVVTGATPEQMAALGYKPVGRDFPVFIHPRTGEEYALARTEMKQGHGYKGFIFKSDPKVSLDEDLRRRDLTINAMAEDNQGNIIDPFGGQLDLKHKILRHVSDAFIEDPLRVLRVARFHARFAGLGFKIAPDTLALMRKISDSGELKFLTSERIWQEMEKALYDNSPVVFFQTLKDCHALQAVLPELDAFEAAAFNRLERASAMNPEADIRFACLMHGLGQSLDRLCQRLNVPGHFRDLALLSSNDLNVNNKPSPETVLTLLLKLDAFRRPQRFEKILTVWRILHPVYPDPAVPSLDFLEEALKHCQTVTAQPFVQQGLKGAQLGEAIKRARIECIKKMKPLRGYLKYDT